MQPHVQRALIACNFICGYPQDVEVPENYAGIYPYFLAPALLLGLGTVILAGVFILALPPIATALFGAVGISLLWLLVSRGQNLQAVGSVVHSLETEAQAGGVVQEETADLHRQLAIYVLLLLKLACLAILLYHGAWYWLFLVPVLSVLCAVEMSVHLGYFTITTARLQKLRALTVVAFIVLGIVAGLKGILATLFIWMLCHVIGRWSRERLPEQQNALISGSSEVTEVLVLILGVILII